MKFFRETVVMWAIGMLPLYFLFSIRAADIDPYTWNEVVRTGFAVTGGMWGLILLLGRGIYAITKDM